jgi:hypothetical protein
MLRTLVLSLPLFVLSAPVALAAPTFVVPLERTTNLDPRDGDDPFDSRIEFGFYTRGESATIGQQGPSTQVQGFDVQEVARYTSSMQVIEPRLKISLFSRLMLYVDLPIVLGWEQTWKATAAYRNETLMYEGHVNDDSITYRDGIPRTTRTPAVSTRTGYQNENTTYRKSSIGDLNVGFAFDMLSEISDPSKPTWHWQFNAQLPTGESRNLVYAGADTDEQRGGTVGVKATQSAVGGVSEDVYRFTTRTILTRWVGKFRPYFAIDYSFGVAASNDYDSYKLYDENYGEGFPLPSGHLARDCSVGPERMVFARCRNKTEDVLSTKRSNDFGDGIKPRHIGGTEFGVSTGLWSSGKGGSKSYVKGDILVRGEYVSEGREFNRMSDLLGRPTAEEQFARVGINAGLRFATAGMLEARLLGSMGKETPHFTTFEDVGTADKQDPSDDVLPAGSPDANTINHAYEYSPYYREAFDGVGNRFKLLENSFYSLNFDVRIRF